MRSAYNLGCAVLVTLRQMSMNLTRILIFVVDWSPSDSSYFSSTLNAEASESLQICLLKLHTCANASEHLKTDN
jgi:hypothetical protein